MMDTKNCALDWHITFLYGELKCLILGKCSLIALSGLPQEHLFFTRLTSQLWTIQRAKCHLTGRLKGHRHVWGTNSITRKSQTYFTAQHMEVNVCIDNVICVFLQVKTARRDLHSTFKMACKNLEKLGLIYLNLKFELKLFSVFVAKTKPYLQT